MRSKYASMEMVGTFRAWNENEGGAWGLAPLPFWAVAASLPSVGNVAGLEEEEGEEGVAEQGGGVLCNRRASFADAIWERRAARRRNKSPEG